MTKDDAIKAIEGERVNSDETGDATDIAYNRALDHAITAVSALADAGWMDIESDNPPVDESILCAIKVMHNKTGASWWEMHVIQIDSETGEIHSDSDAGWAAEDYQFWMPLPPPPEKA